MFATLRQHLWIVVFGWLLISAGFALRADEQPKKKSEASNPPPSVASTGGAAKAGTTKVERGPFRSEVSLKGIFEAANMTEVSVHLEAPMPLKIATAVEPGTVVKKGDVLVTFDAEKMERALRDLEADKDLAELTLKQSEEELPLLERGTPLELEAAAKLKKEADEDLKHFLEVDRGWSEKSAHFFVKNTTNYLEYAKEELKQLQKMYRNKDLTEETEEIILKRQRNYVEQATFYLGNAMMQRDQILAFQIPRREQMLREGAAKANLALEKAKSSLPLALSQKRLALAKARYDRAKATEHLERVRRDRELMTVKSPADGVVYLGRCARGNWVTAGDLARRLARGGMVQPDEVFVTIVDPADLFVRATVDEKDLAAVTDGASAKVTATALPDVRIPARLQHALSTPLGAGAFEAKLELQGSKPATLVAGMACTVTLVPYRKTDALTVPVAAVFHDDDDPYVYVDGKEKAEKRTVKTGHTSSDRIEIVDGLHEGDAIRLSKP
jgi:HlyD family secretion protein